MAAQLNSSVNSSETAGTTTSTRDEERRPSLFFTSSSAHNKSVELMETCFNAFDSDRDGCLNFSEFEVLCRALFRDESDDPYHVDENLLKDMFDIFDVNQKGALKLKEFEVCWQRWIKKIVTPKSALIIVDVQNDFINGSLAMSNCEAKQNGEEVVPVINELLETVEFDCVFYSLDFHPPDHVSFIDNIHLRNLHESSPITKPERAQTYDTVIFDGHPPFKQKLWPRHCVQGQWGAKLHEDLRVAEGSSFIYKGTNPEVDSYSAFWDNGHVSATTLDSELKSKGVTDCFVCGIAYDVCVGATAMHAIESGYRTALIQDCSRGTSISEIESTEKSIRDRHGVIIKSSEVKNLVQGRNRRPELGYKLALEIRKQMKAGDHAGN